MSKATWRSFLEKQTLKVWKSDGERKRTIFLWSCKWAPNSKTSGWNLFIWLLILERKLELFSYLRLILSICVTTFIRGLRSYFLRLSACKISYLLKKWNFSVRKIKRFLLSYFHRRYVISFGKSHRRKISACSQHTLEWECNSWPG